MVERVAFLVEETGERLSALLNPSSVRVRRQAGLRTLGDRPGTIAGAGATDDMVVSTSGGRTEIELELLFDITLAATDPTNPVVDVRQLTGPLWRLSENQQRSAGVPALRMVWGTRWNVCAVVEAVSERLEHFDDGGAPTRSLLAMRLVRTSEELTGQPQPALPLAVLPAAPSSMHTTPRAPIGELPGSTFHEVLGGEDGQGERLDVLAARYYGNPSYWRYLAAVNALTDGLPWVHPGRVLVVPPVEVLATLPAEEDEPVADATIATDVVTEVTEVSATVELVIATDPVPAADLEPGPDPDTGPEAGPGPDTGSEPEPDPEGEVEP